MFNVSADTTVIELKKSTRARRIDVALIREDQPRQMSASECGLEDRRGWYWLWIDNGHHCVGMFAPGQVDIQVNHSLKQGLVVTRQERQA